MKISCSWNFNGAQISTRNFPRIFDFISIFIFTFYNFNVDKYIIIN